MLSNLFAVVLAAGEGTRMKSPKTKVLHELSGRPIIDYVIGNLQSGGIKKIGIVVGFKAEDLRKHLSGLGHFDFFYQENRMGSAHALLKCGEYLDKGGTLFVMCGDTPFLRSPTILEFVRFHKESAVDASVMTARMDDPFGYGRIIKDKKGNVSKIAEERDASEEERRIKEINSGIYCFKNTDLVKHLRKVKPNNIKEEYYLTDVIEIIANAGGSINSFVVDDSTEIIGINSQEQLSKAEEISRTMKNNL